jgi:flagellar protein FlaJ
MVKIPERFLDTRKHGDLQRALLGLRKEVSLRKYLLQAIYVSIAVSVVGLVGGFFLFYFFSGMDFVVSIILAIIMGVGLGFVAHWGILKYPSIALSGRKVQIDAMLPHSATYMYSLSKGGSVIMDIFRAMAKDPSQGEMAKEAAAVIRNVEYFGHNPVSAIREVARTTPSEKLRNFLELLVSTEETGGDMEKYLERMCKQFYAEAGAAQKRSLELLSLMAEFYVIILGLGPLLVVVFLILFGLIGSLQMPLMYLFIYFVIPMGFAIFIVILSRFSPSSGAVKHPEKAETKVSGVGMKGTLARAFEKGGFSKLFERIRKKLRKFPAYILFVSVPLAIIFALIQVQVTGFSTDPIVFAVLIAVIPFVMLYELGRRRTEKIEDAFPDFLMTVSSSISSGLTPAQAIKSTSSAALGPLTTEMAKVSGEMEWGAPTSEAMTKFEERIGSGMVTRLVDVMKKAMSASGEISGVVDILAMDASTTRALKQERKGAMMTYIIVVYMSVLVFIFTVGMISTSLFAMPGVGENAIGGARMMFSGISPEQIAMIKLVLFHAALIQSFLSGLVAGQLGSGDVWSGLKHSVILMVISYLLFTTWVLVR